jgi:hypothetical protein
MSQLFPVDLGNGRSGVYSRRDFQSLPCCVPSDITYAQYYREQRIALRFRCIWIVIPPQMRRCVLAVASPFPCSRATAIPPQELRCDFVAIAVCCDLWQFRCDFAAVALRCPRSSVATPSQ